MKTRNILKLTILTVLALCIITIVEGNTQKAKAATTWSITYNWNTGSNSKETTKEK